MAAISDKSELTALGDHEAKTLLAEFGIAFIREMQVDHPADVPAAAREIGFPVVVKGVGENLLHKTDRGLVYLNLADARSVETAVKAICTAAGKALESFSIQPHINGRREFVAGLFRDPQFGPIIMFGSGGATPYVFKIFM